MLMVDLVLVILLIEHLHHPNRMSSQKDYENRWNTRTVFTYLSENIQQSGVLVNPIARTVLEH